MISEKEAKQIARQFAADNGYSGAKLVKKKYDLDDFLPCFAFSLTSKETGVIEITGLPEMLFVEKETGTPIERRMLIKR